MLAAVVAAGAALLSLLWASPALGVEGIPDIEQLLEGPVFTGSCVNSKCHPNINQRIGGDDSRYREIKFSHNKHLPIYRGNCAACHGTFPEHFGSGLDMPKMKTCFACHGLQHGPGDDTIAGADCDECHRTPRERLRPAFHTDDWEYEPHVGPSLKELQSKCMMCHDQKWCDECHYGHGISWKPEPMADGRDPYRYDPQEGCLACHGREGRLDEIPVAPGVFKSVVVFGLEKYAHGELTCIQCHQDFNYEDRTPPTPVVAINAGLSCQTCKTEKMDHSAQTKTYEMSVHGKALKTGVLEDLQETAKCSSCHGGHFIERLDSAEASAALHSAAYRVCARCHKDYYDSYDDYYHGHAYKKGAVDAPACWDCHGAHDVLSSEDADSKVYKANLAKTCGQEGCHRGSGDSFAKEAKNLIHEQTKVGGVGGSFDKLLRLIGWSD